MKYFIYISITILLNFFIVDPGAAQIQERGRGIERETAINKAIQDQLLLQQYVYDRVISVGETEYDVLFERVEERGRIPVIIRLDVPFMPEGLMDAANVAGQRQDIQSVQEDLLYDMVELNITAVRTYKYVPYIAMQVDRDALLHLMESPHVIEIVKDEAVPPALMDSIPLIGADGAWTQGYSGDGYVVVILDTGADIDHPFFENKIVDGACFSSNVPADGATTLCPDGSEEQFGVEAGDDCDLSISGCGHGTHVAGIAAGSGVSPEGEISGVARDADIITVQVFSRFDNEDLCGEVNPVCALTYRSDQIAALDWVYDLRNTYDIASVNMSLGGGQFTSPCDTDTRKPIIDNLRSANIATVIASGNNGFTNALGAPACISTAISVGSTTKDDFVSSFSNTADFLDLLAPGSLIYSAVPDNGFAFFSGTSMAAPHVAGAWAVMRAFDPDLSVENTLLTLAGTGLPVLDTRNDVNITKPRIQLDGAVGGEPAIAVDPDEVDFGVVFVGEAVAAIVRIDNEGDAVLGIQISTDNNVFSYDDDENVSIAPSGSYNLFVVFQPDAVQQFQGTLIINSNDPENPVVEVDLTGEGALGPQIAVSPESFEEEVNTGLMITRTLTISNTGGAPLTFTPSSQPSASPPGMFVAGFGNQGSDRSTVIDLTAYKKSLDNISTNAPVAPLDNDDVIIHHDSDPVTSFTWGGGGPNNAAVRFTPDELEDFYGGWGISRVLIRVNHTPLTARLNIWEGTAPTNPEELLYSEDILDQITQFQWNEFSIDEPIVLQPGKDYWIGFAVSNEWGETFPDDYTFPWTADNGPLVTGKGGWIGGGENPGLDPGSWGQTGSNRNWNIRAALTSVSVDWISFDPNEESEVSPGDETNIDVTFNAANLTPGVYTADIVITSNDPVSPTVLVPVVLTVTDDGVITVDIPYTPGWEMVGLPVGVADSYHKTLFPDAIENTLFSFPEGAYVQADNLEHGLGYWLRFSDSGTEEITGTPITNLDLSLRSGWNLISGLSCPVPIGDVDDTDEIIIPNTLFGWDQGYANVDIINPGQGYWLRTNDEGTVTLSCTGGAGPDGMIAQQEIPDVESITGTFHRLEVGSRSGAVRVLYLGGELHKEANPLSYSLPPAPPAGTFDVRFAGDWSLIEGMEGDILISAAVEHFPLTVKMTPAHPSSGLRYTIREMQGEAIVGEHIIDGDREIELTNTDVERLQVSVYAEAANLPQAYSLSQNYPNPFNPATTIQYALPKDSFVKLEVYNMLGQRVQLLVDEEQPAGYYEVLFDAGRLPSGVYVYRIKAGEFVDVKKLVYLK